MNKFARFVRRGTAVSLAAGFAATVAHAAVPEPVQTSITSGGADGAAVAGLVIVALVGIWVFSLMRKGMGR